jgi:hypothetical protein
VPLMEFYRTRKRIQLDICIILNVLDCIKSFLYFGVEELSIRKHTWGKSCIMLLFGKVEKSMTVGDLFGQLCLTT